MDSVGAPTFKHSLRVAAARRRARQRGRDRRLRRRGRARPAVPAQPAHRRLDDGHPRGARRLVRFCVERDLRPEIDTVAALDDAPAASGAWPPATCAARSCCSRRRRRRRALRPRAGADVAAPPQRPTVPTSSGLLDPGGRGRRGRPARVDAPTRPVPKKRPTGATRRPGRRPGGGTVAETPLHAPHAAGGPRTSRRRRRRGTRRRAARVAALERRLLQRARGRTGMSAAAERGEVPARTRHRHPRASGGEPPHGPPRARRSSASAPRSASAHPPRVLDGDRRAVGTSPARTPTRPAAGDGSPRIASRSRGSARELERGGLGARPRPGAAVRRLRRRRRRHAVARRLSLPRGQRGRRRRRRRGPRQRDLQERAGRRASAAHGRTARDEPGPSVSAPR